MKTFPSLVLRNFHSSYAANLKEIVGTVASYIRKISTFTRCKASVQKINMLC